MQENIFNNQPGNEPENNVDNKNLVSVIGSALAYFFTMLAFILILCPFSFWKGAAMRLQTQCKNKSLKTFVHTSRWPFLSFLKKIFFEFLIDGMIFINYFVGVIVAFVALFSDDYTPFSSFLTILAITYYSSVFLSLLRDLFVLLLLPFQKFLSWASKPAQQIDVDFHNK